MYPLNWHPHVGDPNPVGWITVVLYLVTALSCWTAARPLVPGLVERRLWRVLAIAFLILGINKQIDLQSALTELGRAISISQGWYQQRRSIQAGFIIALATACAIALIILLTWVRRAAAPERLAFIGVTLVIGFVLIRATSFHHIDRFTRDIALDQRWNWILEIGGIIIVLFASRWRRRRAVGSSSNTSSS